MTIHLPEDLDRYVQQQVASGRFVSADEVVSEAVRQFQRSDPMTDHGTPRLTSNGGSPAPAWQRILDLMKGVPDHVFDQIPTDSSVQLDHYLYSSPKRPPA